ncbi:serine--tRNA ligase, mitochondrial-like [Dreissena polymorpha]|uniref:serine--tRNA ligase n=1 Tax=Dreissena polymorpha TaxID=45954 RepID=A0A9D4R467_DREPO|nr:serine--tRNA ligase, mitochondrial-like [Dreissena polymorpha]XP_052269236.1 serine--tRNA ligase, mitochondrial-like [Dreissena polymorpha]KAH3854476.1 hypothetical protein DPMN_097018 [Dreissena polymorpha]
MMMRKVIQTGFFTWSKINTLHLQLRGIATTPVRYLSNQRTDTWQNNFQLQDADLDLDNLLDARNRDTIRDNITRRKGVGDIDRVIDLWKQYSTEIDMSRKEDFRQQFLSAAREIPNLSHPHSPVGDEHMSRQVELFNKPKSVSWPLKSVVELGQQLGMLRISNVSMTTGPSTYYFTDKLARMEYALVKYSVDHLLKMGFELVSVPDLLRPEIIEGCGFKTTGEVAQVYMLDPSRHDNLCLAGTAEMPLAGLLAGGTLDFEELPKKFMAVSRCYRAETSHAENELGIYRVHQFTKVEMFAVASSETMEEGNELLMQLLDIEKTLFGQLGLHYRVLDMSTAELGAPAHRKFDMEAWMPTKQFWGEISSASNCTDYQSRRLHLRYKSPLGQLKHCTTVNGTACAVPRTIIALLETHQNEDGSVSVPEGLRPYMGGDSVIRASDQGPKLTWIKDHKRSVQ